MMAFLYIFVKSAKGEFEEHSIWPIKWVLRALSPRVKQPGREADHSPPASAEVKKIWIYTSTLPYVLWLSA
jgi:hypothetical protein